MERRALIVVLALLGAVAVITGAMGVVLGPAAAPGGGPTSASIDNEYRFVNVFWTAAGLALWWSLIRLRARRAVARTVLTIAAIGGLARVLSVLVTGWPSPVYIGAMVLELAIVPVVIWWHARVVREEGAVDRLRSAST